MLRVLSTKNQSCLATNQIVAGCENLLQKIESKIYFLQQILYMLRVLIARGKLVLGISDLNLVYGVSTYMKNLYLPRILV